MSSPSELTPTDTPHALLNVIPGLTDQLDDDEYDLDDDEYDLDANNTTFSEIDG